MNKLLFIDRDGTLIIEPDDQQIDSLEKLEFYPGVFSWLSRIAAETDFELVMVTNQDGLGTDSFPESDFWPVQNKLLQALAGEGIRFSAIHIDRSMPYEKKPKKKMDRARLKTILRDAGEIIWRSRRRLLIGIPLLLLNRASSLVLPGTTKYLLDDVIGKHNAAMLLPLALVANQLGFWLVRRTPQDVFYKITLGIMLIISIELTREGVMEMWR